MSDRVFHDGYVDREGRTPRELYDHLITLLVNRIQEHPGMQANAAGDVDVDGGVVWFHFSMTFIPKPAKEPTHPGSDSKKLN